MDLVKDLHQRALRKAAVKELAERAAAAYVGGHEHICGNGEIEGTYADGFQAGYEAAQAAARKVAKQ